MNKGVKSSKPINIVSSPIYKLPSSNVKYIKNAFITGTGLVCDRKGFIKECCHYEWNGQSELGYTEVIADYCDTEDNPENLLMFDDKETYLIVHNRWHVNYFHWLNEAIYRLWLVKYKTHTMVLLLPSKEQLSKIAFDSLKVFNFKDIVYIPEGKSVQVKTLCLPVQKPIMESYNPLALADIRRMYVNYASSKSIAADQRIYISRKNSSRRKVANEDEVLDIMTRYNFNVVYCENYTFFEQVELFSHANFLISNHGAGLTNMLFMPQGSTILELVKRKTNPVRHQSQLYCYMADALGHKYTHQICEPTDDFEMFFTADILVDINILKANLDLLFTDKSYKYE